MSTAAERKAVIAIALTLVIAVFAAFTLVTQDTFAQTKNGNYVTKVTAKKTSKGFYKVTVKTKKPGQIQWAINKGRAVWYGGMDTGKDCSYTFKKIKYGDYLFRVKGDNKGVTKKGWKAKTLKKY